MATGDVVAELSYLQKLDLYKTEKPFQIFIPIEDGSRQNNLEFESKAQTIVDMRDNIDTFSLDTHGFEVRRFPTAVPYDKMADRETIISQYLAEVEDHLKFIEGGFDRVFFFDWRIRTSDQSKHDRENMIVDINAKEQWLDPVTRVHVDQAPRSVVHRIRLQLGDDASFLMQGRVRIIKYVTPKPFITESHQMVALECLPTSELMPYSSAWRPLENPVYEWPLALCDSSSMPQEDLVETDHVRRRFKGTAYYAYYNPDHKWYYLGGQTPDEVMFLKIFDSDSSVKATRCPHSSFHHPSSPPNSPARQSIEVRALVFNYPEGIDPPNKAVVSGAAAAPAEVHA